MKVDMRRVPKLVKNLEESLPLAKGELLLRYELRGTNCEAHITVRSNKDTVKIIDRFGEDELMEVLERNENTISKKIAFLKSCQFVPNKT